MTTSNVDLGKLRWALAERLPGMREPCPRNKDSHGHFQVLRAKDSPYLVCPDCGLQGFGKKDRPVPFTAEGLIDDTRLLRALLDYQDTLVTFDGREWRISFHFGSPEPHEHIGHDKSLAIAFLRAVRV